MARAWLSFVFKPLQDANGRAETIKSLLGYLVPLAVFSFIDQLRHWAIYNWHWFVGGLVVLVFVFGLSSWRLFTELHPVLDLRIVAGQKLASLSALWNGMKYEIWYVPDLDIDPRHSNPPQLEFRLVVPEVGSLGMQPMNDIISSDTSNFPESRWMSNPKEIVTNGGSFIRHLGFTNDTLHATRMPGDRTAVLEFRNRKGDRQWYSMEVPGIFDTRDLKKRPTPDTPTPPTGRGG